MPNAGIEPMSLTWLEKIQEWKGGLLTLEFWIMPPVCYHTWPLARLVPAAVFAAAHYFVLSQRVYIHQRNRPSAWLTCTHNGPRLTQEVKISLELEEWYHCSQGYSWVLLQKDRGDKTGRGKFWSEKIKCEAIWLSKVPRDIKTCLKCKIQGVLLFLHRVESMLLFSDSSSSAFNMQ